MTSRRVPTYRPYHPDRPMEEMEAAKKRAGVQCRFHDLRHTGCTRMLEAGVAFSVLATLMGWAANHGPHGQALRAYRTDCVTERGGGDLIGASN